MTRGRTDLLIHGAERGEELQRLLDDLVLLAALEVGVDNVRHRAPAEVAHQPVQLHLVVLQHLDTQIEDTQREEEARKCVSSEVLSQ